jgi:hypothetical protein
VRAQLQPTLDASGNNRLADSQIARLFDAFRAGLKDLATTASVVLVFDEFSKSGGGSFDDTEYKTWLYPQLIEPILQGKLGAVCVVLSMRERDMETYGLKQAAVERIPPGLVPFNVELFDAADAEKLFREFCRFQWSEVEDLAFKLLQVMLKRDRLAQWSPRLLEDFRRFRSDGRAEGMVRP